jgi:tRNA pseudouridine13 synthase
MLAARSARSACTPLTSFVMKRNFASRGNRGNFDSNTSKVAKVDSRNGPPVSLIAPPSTFAPETALTYDEPALGISAYLRVGIPFTGIIKSRFADFQVHEIDATGRVVQLTNVDVPAEELAASKAASEEAAKHKAMMNSTEQIDISAVVSDLVSICGQDAAQGFSMWFQAAQAFRIAASAQNATPAADADASGAAATPALQAPSESFSFPASLDKAARTALHTTFKANLQMLISDFKDGAVIVRFLRKNERAQVRGNRNAPEASKLATDLSSKFLQFVLYKENRDTMTAVSALARAMHTRAKSFSYAGTKDKRGQTTQLITCTARGMSARHVLAATRYDEMRAGNFQYVTDALRLGSLQGNRFTIVLRDVKLLSGDLSSMEDSINAAAESVRTKGFINYFGLQRFGTSTISTHRIGRALLCRDYALAIYLILAPRYS